MGFFDKKYCDICGEKIGLLGNRKLDDGNLCKECAKKLSPWFEDRRHSTVADIKEQLAYREANKEKVKAFRATRDLAGDSYHVFIDDNQRKFAVATGMNTDINPDIVDLSQIVSCRLDIEEDKDEEKYKDKDGNMQSYCPPRYKYSYDYWIRISVNSPWFDDMDFKLNTFSVKDEDRRKMMEMENLASQIVTALTGVPYVPQGSMMNTGMYGQQGMMSNGMMGQQGMMNNGMMGQGMMNTGMMGQGGMMNNGMYGQQGGMMNNGMYGQQAGMMNNGMMGQQGMMNNGMMGQQGMMNNGMYGQQAGMMNNGMMGQGMMNNGMMGQQGGFSAEMAGVAGAAHAGAQGTWQCSCGAVNSTKFCQQCGQPRPEGQF